MKRFFLSKEQLNNGVLDGEEFNHASNVLRIKVDEEFVAIVGDDYNYICKVTQLLKHSLNFIIVKKELNNKNPNKKIAVVQALAKGEKLELVVQKVTEIGASHIVPIYLTNCDVKQNTGKLERLNKIIISACKQCGRSMPPVVDKLYTIKTIAEVLNNYDLVLIANEREDNLQFIDILNKNNNVNSIAYIVGPEGGFTLDEINQFINMGAVSVSLGNRILRTETASIYMCSVIASFYGV